MQEEFTLKMSALALICLRYHSVVYYETMNDALTTFSTCHCLDVCRHVSQCEVCLSAILHKFSLQTKQI